MSSDAEKQQEELEALGAIFGEDFTHSEGERSFEVALSSPISTELDSSQAPRVTLLFTLPHNYPSSSAPSVRVGDCPWLSGEDRRRLGEAVRGEIANQESTSGGEVYLFSVIESVKEQEWLWRIADSALHEHKRVEDQQRQLAGALQAHQQRLQDQHESQLQKKKREEEEERRRGEERKGQGVDRALGALEDGSTLLLQREEALGIRHGEAVFVRKSVFQAHLAPARTVSDVRAVMDTLLENRKLSSATHNIMAYRICPRESKGTVHQDWDDDGESAAGGRLLHLLQVVGASDVVVVVSRWFGGVLLGPERFRHINNAARSLLVSCGYCSKDPK